MTSIHELKAAPAQVLPAYREARPAGHTGCAAAPCDAAARDVASVRTAGKNENLVDVEPFENLFPILTESYCVVIFDTL